MKKIVYILTLAVAIVMAACNTTGESSVASSDKTDGNSDKAVSVSSTVNDEAATQTTAQDGNMPTPDIAPLPGSNQATPAQPVPAPKAPFSAEDAAKYKEGIKLVKDYSDELNKCVDAKTSGKDIDAATKQRITEIQNKLNDLEKAGKMNQQLIDLKKVSDDVYNKVLAK